MKGSERMPEHPYDSSAILCRRCLEKNIDVRELRAYLDGYVRELPEEMRVTEATYRARLAICDTCARRTGFTCTLCGCYVQTRAAKRAQRCPEKRWDRQV